jgi:L,D-peptidoglycan transpeptidase YkuD (ErfK/YbiS/YcfS/YnhG family)
MTITRRTFVGAVTAAGLSAAAPARAAEADVIFVRAPKGARSGELSFAGRTYPCLVGKSGIVSPKFEDDGGTPAGRFHLREVRFRKDKLSAAPTTQLPCFPAAQSDGWCDDPSDPNYNKLVTLPYPNDCEKMWRDDGLYDLLAVIGYNDAPVVPGAGSAIFLHVRRAPDDPIQWTAGCVSIDLSNLAAVLAACTPATQIDIRVT